MLDWLRDFTHTAPPHVYWMAVIAALAAGCACAWGTMRAFQRKRLIEDTPTALIRSASQGYVELQGRARFMDGDEIFARLSNRLSVWYHYKVEKRQRRSGSSSQQSGWVTIEHETSDDMFYLEDNTGVCAVDADGATVTPAHVNVWYGSSRIPGRYHDDDGTWWARGIGQLSGSYRYTERRIEPGDQLYALGYFVTHSGGASNFDRSAAVSEKLRQWKQDQRFMLEQFDTNDDGEIDLEEWERARAKAEQQVENEMGGNNAPPPVDVLRRSGQRRRPFIIHAGTEEEARTRLNRQALGLLILGVPVLVMAIWSLGLKLSA